LLPELIGLDPNDTFKSLDLDYEIALYGRPVSEMAQDGLPPQGCWGEHAEPMFEQIWTFANGRDEEFAALLDEEITTAMIESDRLPWRRAAPTAAPSWHSHRPRSASDGGARTIRRVTVLIEVGAGRRKGQRSPNLRVERDRKANLPTSTAQHSHPIIASSNALFRAAVPAICG